MRICCSILPSLPTSLSSLLHPPSSFSCSPSAANLLLQDTVERIHVGRQYGDIPRGIYLVRGENVALCGEIVSHLLFGSLSYCTV